MRAIHVSTPLKALHDHNEAQALTEVIQRLQRGEDCALISDAGTPLISDPGFKLVEKALAEGIAVIAIPGPSAVIAALSIAGLPTDRFVFEGFLPSQESALTKTLQSFAQETRTMVFYEAPHRIKNTLKIASDCFGAQRIAVIARELTKRHESILKASLSELHQRALMDPNISRGEIVFMVAGAPAVPPTAETGMWVDALALFLQELPVRTAVDWVCQLYGVKRNIAYDRALQLKAKNP
jgi:16S rRNA (cytidine1402-2'-O)-methyltransferase